MLDVITFGEILLRLSPPAHQRLLQTEVFEVNVGGSEMNVASSLAQLGLKTGIVTRIPDNLLGKKALSVLRKYSVGTDHVQEGGSRLGTYYLEHGTSIRSSHVIYDRECSALAELTPGTIDWDRIFKSAKLFHWSGITPAISAKAAEVCREALIAARDKGITISADLNYRSKLWNYGKEPSEVMPELLSHCGIILGDIDTACKLLAIEPISPDYFDELTLRQAYHTVFDKLPNLELMATTLRMKESASYHRISGVLSTKEDIKFAEVYHVNPIVDRVGSGDAFMAGLLYGFINFGSDYQRIVDFSTASCALKHTIQGDISLMQKDEIYNVMNGQVDGSISR
ncbi:MAG: sugar kinase [Cyclobacteriaceae bacterium]